MLISGILNPQILWLLAEVRHTNRLVIADRGFPFWPDVETVDISLVDGIPSVLDVIRAVRACGSFKEAYMAQEFEAHNGPATRDAFAEALGGIDTKFEPHVEFKKRVPGSIGLIRTAETVQYANVILVSG